MKIGMPIAYAGGFKQTVEELREFEDNGLDVVMMPEAYSFDSVSQLGYIAARTERLEIASNILNIYSRTPTLLAMTAAGIDYVSEGRFTLGIGASGPQVVEGFHGVPYGQPLARTREVVDICRKVWRRERVEHEGKFFHLPLTEEHGGSGLGKALKLINHPVRERIPMVLAAIGPKNVELAAELFEGWEPIFYYPEAAKEVFGPSIDAGNAKRAADLGTLQIVADTDALVTDDADELAAAVQQVREHLALYIGGMGARGKNFYNDLAVRYGFPEAAEKIQDLYLEGKKDEAAAAVPDELVHGIALLGSPSHVAERAAAFKETGATTLNIHPINATHEGRVKTIKVLKEVAG
jgi:F420-dependent oxidoreductase-like protein